MEVASHIARLPFGKRGIQWKIVTPFADNAHKDLILLDHMGTFVGYRKLTVEERRWEEEERRNGRRRWRRRKVSKLENATEKKQMGNTSNCVSLYCIQ